ncbi:19425_t:CDS:2, partial [Gigaspora rosea]
AAAILNQLIMQNQVNSSGLKTYVETRWTSVYECISSIEQLKTYLEEIQENHSEIISPTILTILRGRAVESNHAILANCYINLIKIVAAIQNLSSNEYKGFRNYCIGLKFGTFPLIANYAENYGNRW